MPQIAWKINNTINNTVVAVESQNATTFSSEIQFNPPKRNNSGNYTCYAVSKNNSMRLEGLKNTFVLIFQCKPAISIQSFNFNNFHYNSSPGRTNNS